VGVSPGTREPLANPRVVAIPIAYNEGQRLGRVLERLAEVPGIDTAVVDDASTDRTPEIVREHGVTLVRREARGGAGAAVRTAYAFARERGYDVCVVLSGNDKDRPSEMHRLIEPIVKGEADLVQGSRYLAGGEGRGMPRLRRFASQVVHPWLFTLFARRRMTDTTNGYRALRLSILDDPRIDLDQRWLDRYELEVYLLFQVARLGYGLAEVPVTKVYPYPLVNYTRMRAGVGWWSILRPILLLGLGLRR
jgi:dolichol-phosphate mannosyltransferase